MYVKQIYLLTTSLHSAVKPSIGTSSSIENTTPTYSIVETEAGVGGA